MLQVNKSPALADRAPSAFAGAGQSNGPPEMSPAELIASLAGFFRRQYPVVLFVLLLAVGLGAVYLLTTPARFIGRAAMIIDTRKVQLFQQLPGMTMVEDPIRREIVRRIHEVRRSGRGLAGTGNA